MRLKSSIMRLECKWIRTIMNSWEIKGWRIDAFLVDHEIMVISLANRFWTCCLSAEIISCSSFGVEESCWTTAVWGRRGRRCLRRSWLCGLCMNNAGVCISGHADESTAATRSPTRGGWATTSSASQTRGETGEGGGLGGGSWTYRGNRGGGWGQRTAVVGTLAAVSLSLRTKAKTTGE